MKQSLRESPAQEQIGSNSWMTLKLPAPGLEMRNETQNPPAPKLAMGMPQTRQRARGWARETAALARELPRKQAGGKGLSLSGERVALLPGEQRAQSARSPLAAIHRDGSADRPKEKQAAREKPLQMAAGQMSDGQRGESGCATADRSTPAAPPPQSTAS